jgi:hypothetical protein
VSRRNGLGAIGIQRWQTINHCERRSTVRAAEPEHETVTPPPCRPRNDRGRFRLGVAHEPLGIASSTCTRVTSRRMLVSVQHSAPPAERARRRAMTDPQPGEQEIVDKPGAGGAGRSGGRTHGQAIGRLWGCVGDVLPPEHGVRSADGHALSAKRGAQAAPHALRQGQDDGQQVRRGPPREGRRAARQVASAGHVRAGASSARCR